MTITTPRKRPTNDKPIDNKHANSTRHYWNGNVPCCHVGKLKAMEYARQMKQVRRDGGAKRRKKKLILTVRQFLLPLVERRWLSYALSFVKARSDVPVFFWDEHARSRSTCRQKRVPHFLFPAPHPYDPYHPHRRIRPLTTPIPLPLPSSISISYPVPPDSFTYLVN